MIVLCEDCGAKFFIDMEKLKSNVGRFQCTACNHVNTVVKPPAKKINESEVESTPADTQEEVYQTPNTNLSQVGLPNRNTLLGIRGRLMIFFVVIPIILLSAAGIVYLNQSNVLAKLITAQSNQIVTDMATSLIGEKGRSVASEIKVYLDAHPELNREDYNKSPEFKKIAVQSIGKTGYTVIINRPRDNEPCRIWAHPNDKLVGVDVFKAMQKKFGEEGSKGFIEIHKKAFKTGEEISGYYRFLDNRDKYMVIVPVEGTDLFLPSTTYIDEFTQPMVDLEAKANNIIKKNMRMVIFIQVAIIFLIALIALLYGNSLSGKIRYLTEVTEHISIGELDKEISIKSNDEIGGLATAIMRMQDSVRISIERLRRRKK
jgi:predicted Zn finger-like uncharacterized protein